MACSFVIMSAIMTEQETDSCMLMLTLQKCMGHAIDSCSAQQGRNISHLQEPTWW